MRHTIMLALLFSATAPALAQTRQAVTIAHATVFLQGAELSSRARISLPQGESQLLFTNVAGNVNPRSLSVSAGRNVVVQAASFQNNYLSTDSLSPRAQQIQDSIQLLTDANGLLADKLAVADEQLALLRENRRIAGTNSGLTVAELQKMIELVQSRMEQLLTTRRKLEENRNRNTTRISLLQQQLNEERQRGFQPGGQLLVRFYATQATTTDVQISYVVPNAGWTPAYDLRVDRINSPVNLFYKANVYQNSGVRWDKVKLTLSTGNPSEGAEAPVLNPWFLSFYTPPPRPRIPTTNAAPMSNVRGARSDGSLYSIEGVQARGKSLQESSMDQYVQVDNQGINTSFDIELPYSIPSDGQQQVVAVKTYELPATYRYYAVPRLDRDAFLQARVTDWEDLNLLPAQTSIFYEGTYVGQGYIDMRQVRDTLNLSLGRDKKIIIRRELDKGLRSVRSIGSNQREEFAYTISLRNTRQQPVDITVLDQFPVSQDAAIEVDNQSAPDAEVNKETGAVQWTLSIPPSSLKTMKLSYRVTYPKGKTIGNLR